MRARLGRALFCYVDGRGRAAAEINLLSNVLPGSGAVVKARQNNRGKKATASRAGRASRKGATRDDVLDRMRAVVLGSAVEMMEAVCEEGKRGSYLHTKFALEAGLLYPPQVQVADPKVAEAQRRSRWRSWCSSSLSWPTSRRRGAKPRETAKRGCGTQASRRIVAREGERMPR